MTDACTGDLDTGFVTLGYGKVAFLGVVQGLSELMPISSTAHMRVVPALFGWTDPGSAFSAAMQLAALAAVVAYFRSDILGIINGSVEALRRRDFADWDLRFATYVVLATIPIGVGGLLLSKTLNACNSPLRSLHVIGGSCIVMGLLLIAAERVGRHLRQLVDVRLSDALIVGFAQVGALIPGVSRSGSTLTAARFLGFERQNAAYFSFLLGLPAITLAGLKELYELHKAHLDGHGWSVLAVGLAVGSISAFAAIALLMRILERFATWPFAAYRLLLGALLLVGGAAGVLH